MWGRMIIRPHIVYKKSIRPYLMPSFFLMSFGMPSL